MSFILDALRKSEQERQRQAGPGFAELRPAMTRPGFPVWAVALGALLAINLVVLMVVMATREDAPAVASQPSPAAASPAPTTSAAYSAPANAPDLAAPVPSRTEMPSDLYAPGANEPARSRHDEALTRSPFRVPLKKLRGQPGLRRDIDRVQGEAATVLWVEADVAMVRTASGPAIFLGLEHLPRTVADSVRPDQALVVDVVRHPGGGVIAVNPRTP